MVSLRQTTGKGNKQASDEIGDDIDHAGERAVTLIESQCAFEFYRECLERGVAKDLTRLRSTRDR